jgi:hypothetical protein
MSYKEFVDTVNTLSNKDLSVSLGKFSELDRVTSNQLITQSAPETSNILSTADSSSTDTGNKVILEIRIHYYVGNIDDPEQRLFIEDVMSRSLTSMNELSKLGDVSIFKEETTFTKDGSYLVAIKYGEVHAK